MNLTEREIALLHQCVEFSLANIDHLEEITDENVQAELEALKHRLDKE